MPSIVLLSESMLAPDRGTFARGRIALGKHTPSLRVGDRLTTGEKNVAGASAHAGIIGTASSGG